jgi:hypothetical protein
LPFENCVTAQTFDGWVYRREFGATAGDWRVIDAAFYQWKEHLGYWQHQKTLSSTLKLLTLAKKLSN